MTTYTDTQLKQALAKMLPEHIIYAIEGSFNRGTVQKLRWANLREVLDTELLHLCWLAEQTLPIGEFWECKYDRTLTAMTTFTWKTSWQQRVIALTKVKGVEIV